MRIGSNKCRPTDGLGRLPRDSWRTEAFAPPVAARTQRRLLLAMGAAAQCSNSAGVSLRISAGTSPVDFPDKLYTV